MPTLSFKNNRGTWRHPWSKVMVNFFLSTSDLACETTAFLGARKVKQTEHKLACPMDETKCKKSAPNKCNQVVVPFWSCFHPHIFDTDCVPYIAQTNHNKNDELCRPWGISCTRTNPPSRQEICNVANQVLDVHAQLETNGYIMFPVVPVALWHGRVQWMIPSELFVAHTPWWKVQRPELNKVPLVTIAS